MKVKATMDCIPIAASRSFGRCLCVCMEIVCLLGLARSLQQPTLESISSRSKFLSSTATAFLASATLVMGTEPEECQAAVSTAPTTKNPRYIDQELEMKYGEDASEW